LTIAADAVGSDGGVGVALEHAESASITTIKIADVTSTGPSFQSSWAAGFSAPKSRIARSPRNNPSERKWRLISGFCYEQHIDVPSGSDRRQRSQSNPETAE
jgi:hypothetical protein